MSGFAIYAFVITGLYIIYIGVVILMDLFVKKDQKKDSSEEFNNSGMVDADEDSSTVVDETSDGYAVRHPGDAVEDEPVEEVEDEDSEVPQEEQPAYDNPDDEELLEQESLESQAEYESLKAVQASMDAVTPSYQDEYRSDDFAVLMAQPIKQKSRILRHFVDI